jgi:anti-sigma-K factor RskA
VRLFRYDLHSLTGAYAVDAIDDEAEREKFERHMSRCQQCAGEVRGLTETATRIGFAASRPPPEAMRGTVLTVIAQTRQLPPIVTQRRAKASTRRAVWTGRLPLLSSAFAAGCAGVAIVLLVVLVGTRHQLDRVQARNAALASVLNAPDSRSITQTTSDGGHATLVFSLRRHAMIFTSHGLPPPPPGKVYELWLIGPPHVRPAGLLGPGQAGQAGPVVAQGVVKGDNFGITIEPAGGTKTPTTTPILDVPLRH